MRTVRRSHRRGMPDPAQPTPIEVAVLRVLAKASDPMTVPTIADIKNGFTAKPADIQTVAGRLVALRLAEWRHNDQGDEAKPELWGVVITDEGREYLKELDAAA